MSYTILLGSDPEQLILCLNEVIQRQGQSSSPARNDGIYLTVPKTSYMGPLTLISGRTPLRNKKV